MEVAGGALIRPRAVLVDLGGREYRIPARPAADWMLIILERAWSDIVPGMLEGDLNVLFDQLALGEVTAADCERAAQDALGAAAGAHWWTVLALIHSAAADPAAFGELANSSIDLGTAPLGAALVSLYRIYTRDRDKKDVAKLNHELARLPEGVSAVETRYNPDAAAAAFEEQFARRGGR